MMDANTQSNIAAEGDGGVLFMQAALSPKQAMFMIGFGGQLTIGDAGITFTFFKSIFIFVFFILIPVSYDRFVPLNASDLHSTNV